MCICLSLLVYHTANHRELHSFPTRRSSDLGRQALVGDAPSVHLAQGRARGAARRGPRQGAGEGLRMVHRSEEHTSELQSLTNLVCRLLLEKKKKRQQQK